MKITFTKSAHVFDQIKNGSADPRTLEYWKHYMPAAHLRRMKEIEAAEEMAAVASHQRSAP